MDRFRLMNLPPLYAWLEPCGGLGVAKNPMLGKMQPPRLKIVM
jgi:hypothetical protein